MAAHACVAKIHMARTYTLKKRAEQQAETRQRIVEAAVDLHSTVGPALTTFSMVAERAGVQRHTLYAHFPNERSLFMACSGRRQSAIRCPMPSPGEVSRIARERLRGRPSRRSMSGIERNAEIDGMRAARRRIHPLTREIAEMRSGPLIAAYHEVLGESSEHATARACSAGAELLHMADAGTPSGSRPRSCRRGHGTSHRLRKMKLDKMLLSRGGGRRGS